MHSELEVGTHNSALARRQRIIIRVFAHDTERWEVPLHPRILFCLLDGNAHRRVLVYEGAWVDELGVRLSVKCIGALDLLNTGLINLHFGGHSYCLRIDNVLRSYQRHRNRLSGFKKTKLGLDIGGQICLGMLRLNVCFKRLNLHGFFLSTWIWLVQHFNSALHRPKFVGVCLLRLQRWVCFLDLVGNWLLLSSLWHDWGWRLFCCCIGSSRHLRLNFIELVW